MVTAKKEYEGLPASLKAAGLKGSIAEISLRTVEHGMQFENSPPDVYKRADRSVLNYDWVYHEDSSYNYAFGHTDEELADFCWCLQPDDMSIEAVVMAARDRIMALSKEIHRLDPMLPPGISEDGLKSVCAHHKVPSWLWYSYIHRPNVYRKANNVKQRGLSYLTWDDMTVASRVRMLMRQDPEFRIIMDTAAIRIYCLSEYLTELQMAAIAKDM